MNNEHIELPPLPLPDRDENRMRWWSAVNVKAYARNAILADRASRSRAASEPGEVARLAEEARRTADTARHDLLMAIYERHDVAATFFAFDRLAVGKDRDAARNALCEYDRALQMKIDNLMALSALAATATSPASEARAVIAELVALKDLKDATGCWVRDVTTGAQWPKMPYEERMAACAEYNRRKPLAWAAARACATAWGLRIAEKGDAS